MTPALGTSRAQLHAAGDQPRPRRQRLGTAPAELAYRTLLGKGLRTFRQDRGLTQAQLGFPWYTKAYVSAVENGLVWPSVKALIRFADVLGMPAQALLP